MSYSSRVFYSMAVVWCLFSAVIAKGAESVTPSVPFDEIDTQLFDCPKSDNRYLLKPYLGLAATLQSLPREVVVARLRKWAALNDSGIKACAFQVTMITAILIPMTTVNNGGRDDGKKRAYTDLNLPGLGSPFYMGGTTFIDWPEFPIALVDNIPFLPIVGFLLSGNVSVSTKTGNPLLPVSGFLENRLAHGTWNETKYNAHPTDEAMEAAFNKLINSKIWRSPLTVIERNEIEAEIGQGPFAPSGRSTTAAVPTGLPAAQIQSVTGDPSIDAMLRHHDEVEAQFKIVYAEIQADFPGCVVPGPSYRCAAYIKVASLLQQLQRQFVSDQLHIWARQGHEVQVGILCRMLFESKGPEKKSSDLRASGSTRGEIGGAMLADIPFYPILFVDGVPFCVEMSVGSNSNNSIALNDEDEVDFIRASTPSSIDYKSVDGTAEKATLQKLLGGKFWRRPLTGAEIEFLRNQIEP